MLRPGQRCIIVPCKGMSPRVVHHLGKIVTTVRIAPERGSRPYWFVDPILCVKEGDVIAWREDHLQPLPDLDEELEDEREKELVVVRP